VPRRRSFDRLLIAANDLPSPLRDALWDHPDRLVDAGHPVKDVPGDRCTIVRLDRDDRSFILKRYNRKGALHSASHAVLRSRARWSWLNAHRLIDAAIPTPPPLAMLEERLGPLRGRSFLVTSYVDGEPLKEWIAARPDEINRLEAVAERFGEIWRRLGRARLGHGDMKATNFIVDPQENLWLVDLDAVRRYPPGPWLARARRRDRERFLRNWRDRPEVEAAFHARIDTAAPPA